MLSSLFSDLLSRALARKWAPVVLGALFLLAFILGLAFSDTPAFSEYHLRAVDRYLDRVVYSDENVFALFFGRLAGNLLILLLVLLGGIHPAALVLPVTVLAFRAYTFGGALTVLFTVYGAPGVLVVFVLYLPIHLLLDALLLLAASLSLCRALEFRFCTSDFRELAADLGLLAAGELLVCLLEAVLLLALFHPIGNLI